METSRVKPGFNGGSGSIDGSGRRLGYAGSGSRATAATTAAGAPASDACGVTLRVFVVAATLVAAVVMGVDRQTRNIQVTIADTLPPLQVPVTAKWDYSSAFVKFIHDATAYQQES